MSNGGARRRLRAVLGAVLACAAVVVLPVEAWGDDVRVYDAASLYGGASWTSPLPSVEFSYAAGTWTIGSPSNGGQAGVTRDLYCAPSTSGLSASSIASQMAGGTGIFWTTYGVGGSVSDGRTFTCDGQPFVEFTASGSRHVFVTTGLPPADDSTCATKWSNVRAAYADGVLSVRFRWAGSPPASGWDVFVPGSEYPPDDPRVAHVDPTVIGAAGEYGSDMTVSLAAETGTGFRIQQRSSTGCYVVGGLVSDVTTTPPDTGEDGDGFSCGLNPFCYVTAALRWAFVPSTDAVAEWSGRVDDLSDRPPINFITAGSSFVSAAVDGSGCAAATNNPASCTGGASASTSFSIAGASFDPLVGAGTIMQGQTGNEDIDAWGPRLYSLAVVTIWVAFALYAWRRISASLGGRG